MTEIRQPHHYHPLHEDEVKEDVKPWRLPFWTEKPAWLIEKEQQEKQQTQQQANEEAQSELTLPTAEELENIRRDAYNAGLEQGLVEGRQQGEKQGYELGLQQGLDEGRAKGEQEGRQQGFQAGEAQGLQQGQQQIDQQCQQLAQVTRVLQAGVIERDQQLPEVLTGLVSQLCQQVLQHELTVSQSAINRYLHQALQQLPGGESDIQVYLSSNDITHVDKSAFASDLHFHTDPALQPGECRVETRHTLIDYSAPQALTQLLEGFIPALLKAAEHPQPDFDQPLPAKDDATLASADDDTPLTATSQADAPPEDLSQPSDLTDREADA